MASSRKRSRRRRGVVLSLQGWQRLQAAQQASELADNGGNHYSVERLAELTSLSISSLERVRSRRRPVDRQTLEAYFTTFDLTLTPTDYHPPATEEDSPEAIASQANALEAHTPKAHTPETNKSELDEANEPVTNAPVTAESLAAKEPAPIPKTARQLDWGEAIDVSIFHGRREELTTLTQWVVTNRCRLVGILGMGGMGKTALAVKLAEQIQTQFDLVIWRSLRNAPDLASLLEEMVPFLSQQQATESSLQQFLRCLQNARCLVILDNMETLLQSGSRAGNYRPGYENYGELLRLVGESRHQSCLMLTSREKPNELAMFEGSELAVRSLPLRGSLDIALALIDRQELMGTPDQKRDLCDRYGCSPLALKIVASSVQDLFEGNIAQFLAEDTIIFNGVRHLLEQQFKRLSELEHSIMYWLAINREWTPIAELATDMMPPVPRSQLLEALESLSWRSLIEKTTLTLGGKSTTNYTQQPVVMEFITDQLIHQVSQELTTQSVSSFRQFALIKAQAREYVRESQVRLILQPVLDELTPHEGTVPALQHHLMELLEQARGQATRHAGYLAGNSINLLRQLGVALSGCDFSHLPIWQANLQGLTLQNIDFTAADLAKSLFTQRFGGILSVAFSPDQTQLATADTNGDICLWQVANGQPLMRLQGHTNWVLSVMFSPNGDRLVSGSLDRTLRIWNLQDGNCLKVLEGHTDAIWSVAFSPTGDILASGSFDYTIRLWDAQEGSCRSVLKGHENSVRSVAFAPQGDRLASSSADLTVKLWEIETGDCLQTFQGHRETVWSVAFAPTGDTLASGSDDRTVRLWEIASGRCLHCLSGHSHAIWSVAFSADGRTLASGSQDGTVRLWDALSGLCLQRLTGHTNWIWSVAFAGQGDLLASGSQDRTIRLWQVASGHCLRTLSGYANTVWAVAFSPQGDILASGSQDGYVRLWDTQRLGHPHPETSACRYVLQPEGAVTAVAISPNGQWLATGSHDRASVLQIWELASGQLWRTVPVSASAVRAIAFSPDSSLLASGSDDWSVQLWDVSTGQRLHHLKEHANAVWSVAFSVDGQWLASGSFDHTVRLWRVADGHCCEVLEHTGEVGTVAFSPQGNLLASGASADSTVKLWRMSDWQCCLTLAGHHNFIMAIDFSHDGQQLTSSSFDQTVRLWDVQTGECLQVFQGHTQGLWSVAFSPDGQAIASGGDDETIRVWDARTGNCIRTLNLPGPYEGMNITGVTGLSEAQKETLKTLGAIAH
ncbi:MAG: NB-ARC domain-containing protein [Cyanobacteria bacterium P01_F01_bin.86]